MITWPPKLVDDIARRTCVLYICSGISANSLSGDGQVPLTWGSFLEKCIDCIPCDCNNSQEYARELLEHQDMLNACEVVINALGETAFHELTSNSFRRPGFSPARIHEVIYNLDSRIAITPNVDNIYDQYALTTSKGTVIVKKYHEHDVSNVLRSQDRIILKAHGSVDTPSKMIFSRKHYNKARYEYSAFYKILDFLALTHTYIFLGCGINDPDIRLTLENNNFWFPGCHPHYFITSEESIDACMKKILLDNCNLHTLTNNDPNRDHSQLLSSLEELVALVEATRVDLADSQNW